MLKKEFNILHRALLPTLFFTLVGWTSAGDGAASPARTLLNENRLDEAVGICRQFEVLSTIDVDNFLACAWVYLRTDRLDGAERFLDKIRKSGLASAELQLLLAFADLKHKRYEQSRLALNKLIEEQRSTPLGPVTQELSAELYETVGQVDTAAFIYKQVAADEPSRARAHWGLGRYYLSRGDIGRAKTHLSATARLWPKHVGSRYNLAVLLLQANEVAEAAKLLGQCYKINKADPGVLEQLGLVLEKRGNQPEAIKFWRKAVSVSPDAAVAKEKLAQYGTSAIDALIDAGQYDQALSQLNSFGKKVAAEPPFQLRRGIILRYQQKCDQALPVLTQYVQSFPKDAVGHREMGICFASTRKWDRAAVSFANAIDIDPSSGLNHAWLAYVFEVKKKWVEARNHWASAVKLLSDPADLSRARRRLASVESKAGKNEPPPREEESKSGTESNSNPERGMWESPSTSGAQVPQ
jgi:tetratricopeptide (TPR) repeat protein